jgi:hypothetical protein
MALCPAGHQSQTSDYCDTCGAVMGGAAITPASAASASAPASTSSGAAASSNGGGSTAGGTCPQCGAARGGRFCEECGFDFEMAELVPPAIQNPAASSSPLASTAVLTSETEAGEQPDPLGKTAAMPPDYDFDAEFAKAEREFAAGGESAPDPDPEPAAEAEQNANANAAVRSQPSATAAPALLAAVVTADQEYYNAQVERGDIIEDEFPFPRYPGERRFVLETDRIRIGRASASRGIAVEIDLTGPPLDPAVSHLHAQLLRAPDGSWSVVDLNSANGTRLNGAADPLAAETEVPVKAGDRIHLGVWTTLTLKEA